MTKEVKPLSAQEIMKRAGVPNMLEGRSLILVYNTNTTPPPLYSKRVGPAH